MTRHRRTTDIAHPYLVAALAILLLLSAGLAHAQRPVRRVAVAARDLARGTVLGADDFVLRDTTVRRPVRAEPTPVDTGWVTRRAISAGEVLRAPAVEPPVLVAANEPVEIVWTEQNVRLTLHGVATRNASLGERVTVRTDLGRRLDATVVAQGRVRLDRGH